MYEVFSSTYLYTVIIDFHVTNVIPSFDFLIKFTDNKGKEKETTTLDIGQIL